MSFRAPLPPNLPPGALPVHPAGKLPSPRPFVPPISKSWLRQWCSGFHRSNGQSANSEQNGRVFRNTWGGISGPFPQFCNNFMFCKSTSRQVSRKTARRHVVQKDRATLYGAERPRVATACRGTARRYSVQRNHATSRSAEGPRDATACRKTARRYVMQRERAMPRGAESPRDVTKCRGTARHYGVQRNCATPRRAEGPRDATWCRGIADFTSCRGTARR